MQVRVGFRTSCIMAVLRTCDETRRPARQTVTGNRDTRLFGASRIRSVNWPCTSVLLVPILAPLVPPLPLGPTEAVPEAARTEWDGSRHQAGPAPP